MPASIPCVSFSSAPTCCVLTRVTQHAWHAYDAKYLGSYASINVHAYDVQTLITCREYGPEKNGHTSSNVIAITRAHMFVGSLVANIKVSPPLSQNRNVQKWSGALRCVRSASCVKLETHIL